MSNLNVVNEINLLTANNFTVTKESRSKLISLLNIKEQKLFKDFVKSISK